MRAKNGTTHAGWNNCRPINDLDNIKFWRCILLKIS
jgi:hypothetical protein